MEQYPDEIRQRPRAVIMFMGFLGLHEQIQDCFSKVDIDPANPSQVLPCFHVLSMEYGALTPLGKEPRSSYDGYTVEGIMKAAWMERHTTQYPSVVALIVSWAENPTSHWRGKEADVIALIDRTRMGIRSKSIRLVVVLLIRSKVDSEVLADERLGSLRKKADLAEKNFVYFNLDEMQHSAMRLEGVLREQADYYYAEEARRAKKVKDFKKAPPPIHVRVHMKVGYLNEFRMDFGIALKHYLAAYQIVGECLPYVKLWEAKRVAEYLNFKLCKLYLIAGLAVQKSNAQFQRHIKAWKSHIGPQENAFRHWEWLSNQYKAYAELVELYVKGPKISELGKLHTGYFYQTAAAYASRRKEAFRGLEKDVSDSMAVNQMRTLRREGRVVTRKSRYIGADEEVGIQVNEKAEGAGEEVGGFALLSNDQRLAHNILEESTVEHSAIIIALLTRAYEHFQLRRRTSRLLLLLASQIAQEHFQSKNYKIAKEFFDRVAKSYSREQWHSLLLSIHRSALECARCLRQTEEYIRYTVEMVASPSVAQKEAFLLQERLIKALQEPEDIGLEPLERPILINVRQRGANVPQVMSTRVQMQLEDAYAHDEVTCKVELTSHFPLPIRFCRLKITFDNTALNQRLSDAGLLIYIDSKQFSEPELRRDMEVESDAPHKLFLMPYRSKVFTFRFSVPEPMHLQCKFVEVHLGSAPSLILFQWDMSRWRAEPLHPLYEHRAVEEFQRQGFLHRTALTVLEPKPKLTMRLQHSPPALAREFYRVDVTIENGEDGVTGGVLELSVQGSEVQVPDAVDGVSASSRASSLCTFFEDDGVTEITSLTVPSIGPNKSCTVSFYALSAASVPERTITATLIYDTERYKTRLAEEISSPVQEPFVVSWGAYDGTDLQAIDAPIQLRDSFILRFEIECTTPFPIALHNIELKLKPSVATCIAATSLFTEAAQCTRQSDEAAGSGRGVAIAAVAAALENSTDGPPVVLFDKERVIKDVRSLGGAKELSLATLEEEEKRQRAADTVVLTRGSSVAIIYRIRTEAAGDNVAMGDIRLTWERCASSHSSSVASTLLSSTSSSSSSHPVPAICSNDLEIAMPTFKVFNAPYTTQIDYPSSGVVGSELEASLVVRNLTHVALDMSVQVPNTPGFFTSGPKRMTFKILPHATYQVVHRMVAVHAGRQALPQFQLQAKKYNIPDAGKAVKHIYIRPI